MSKTKKNVSILYQKIIIFEALKKMPYIHRHACVMWPVFILCNVTLSLRYVFQCFIGMCSEHMFVMKAVSLKVREKQ